MITYYFHCFSAKEEDGVSRKEQLDKDKALIKEYSETVIYV